MTPNKILFAALALTVLTSPASAQQCTFYDAPGNVTGRGTSPTGRRN